MSLAVFLYDTLQTLLDADADLSAQTLTHAKAVIVGPAQRNGGVSVDSFSLCAARVSVVPGQSSAWW